MAFVERKSLKSLFCSRMVTYGSCCSNAQIRLKMNYASYFFFMLFLLFWRKLHLFENMLMITEGIVIKKNASPQGYYIIYLFFLLGKIEEAMENKRRTKCVATEVSLINKCPDKKSPLL